MGDTPDRYRINARTLRFVDPEVERAFQRSHAERSIPAIRGTLLMAIVLIAGFDLFDGVLAPDAQPTLRLIRFGVLIPPFLLALALTAWSGFWRHMQTVLFGTVVTGYAGLLALLMVFPDSLPTAEGALSTHDGRFLFLIASMLFYAYSLIAMGFLRIVPASVLLVSVVLLSEVGAHLLDPSPLTRFFGVFVCALASAVGLLATYQLGTYRQGDYGNAQKLQEERSRSDALLRNILPDAVAARLKAHDDRLVERYEHVTVMFADLAGFTSASERLPPGQVVEALNTIFSAFDRLAQAHGVEKIKTMGDAYLAAAGVPEPRADHAQAVARLALDMRRTLRTLHTPLGDTLRMRIGVHSGPVVAGVIGAHRFAYDLWGDTVNTANRLERHGHTDHIHLSATTAALLGDAFLLEPRGEVEIKDKGAMQTWWLLGERPQPAERPPP